MNASEKVAQQFLISRGNRVAFFSTSSPDFRGDGEFQAKRVYADKNGQKHVVLNPRQHEDIRSRYPNAKYLFVEGEKVYETPLRGVKPEEPSAPVNGSDFILHWSPPLQAKHSNGGVKMQFTDDEWSRIETIKLSSGVKETPEVIRMALMNQYKMYMKGTLQD